MSLKNMLFDIIFKIFGQDCLENGMGDEISNVEVFKTFCGTAFIWCGIYMLSYYGCSISWLLLPLLLTCFVRKEELRLKRAKDVILSSAKCAACSTEKIMIESRFKADELPSWVVFPDKVKVCSRVA